MIELKYGSGKIRIAIPEKAQVSILEPLQTPVLGSVPDTLEAALDAPLGGPALETIMDERRPRSVAIAVPDETRPAPLREVLPPLLARIWAMLSRPMSAAVTLFIGGGLHPPADAAAIGRILPAGIARGCRTVAHDARTAPPSLLSTGMHWPHTWFLHPPLPSLTLKGEGKGGGYMIS